MRLLLTPDVAPRPGTVILRPGREQLSMFTHGRIIVSPAPSALNFVPSGPLNNTEQEMMASGAGLVPDESHKQLVALEVDPESPQSLMRKPNNELHADLAKFENKYGHQLILLFRFLDHAIAVGVIG